MKMEEETKEMIGKMAEQKKDTDEEEEEENGDLDDSSRSLQTSFLPELNLLMLIAFLSLPSGECLQSEVTSSEGSRWDLEEMMPELRARNQRRERNENHDIGHRKTPRIHTRIMDSRHCRRM